MSIRFTTERVCFILMLSFGLSNSALADSPDDKAMKESKTEAKQQKQPRLVIDYSSVFDTYVPFDDIPEIGWKEANDRVGQIGGWREYARLVQEEAKKAAELESDKEGGDQ